MELFRLHVITAKKSHMPSLYLLFCEPGCALLCFCTQLKVKPQCIMVFTVSTLLHLYYCKRGAPSPAH